VWLDITGAAHLVGGEEALLDELGERVAALGHRARIAIADGPRLAQALARWGLHATAAAPSRTPEDGGEPRISPPGGGARSIAPLPVQALPISPEAASFLVRLGVLRVEDLARLPRASVAARLGAQGAGRRAGAGSPGAQVNEVMDLIAGRDPAPLIAFEVPRLLEEEMPLEEGIESAEPLLFVLRGMTSRVAARLIGRGEACGRLDVEIAYDRSIARLRQTPLAALEGDEGAPDLDEPGVLLRFHVDLPVPLSDAGDLLRPLKAKLDQIELAAPAVGVRLTASRIARARRVQLDLSRDRSVDPDSLPALLAELSAEIGPDRVGVLQIVDAHRPEARSRLAPAALDEVRRRAALPPAREPASAEAPADAASTEPARLLAQPIPLGRVGRGTIVAIDRHLYAIERLRFVMRLDAVEWWTPRPASRDYARAWLVSGAPGSPSPARIAVRSTREGASASTCSEAWIYVERSTGEAFLHGWCE
jgi:protein ImuB